MKNRISALWGRLNRFFAFLFRRFSPLHFNPLLVKENFFTMSEIRPNEWLDADRFGKLKRLETTRQKLLYAAKNIVFLGASHARTINSVYYSFLTYTLVVNNPLTKRILKSFPPQKKAFGEHILKKVEKINDKNWGLLPFVKLHLHLYETGSLLQVAILKKAQKAQKLAKKWDTLIAAQEGIKKGYYPLLVIQGCSGSYWMRGPNREIVGLFKPIDEEYGAPNNPVGPQFQGALGKRKARPNVRVGEVSHREVAAYVVDQFFEFGIVPRTTYATFSHSTFFMARTRPTGIAPPIHTKMGSFQEYIEGFVSISDLPKEKWEEVPEDELQLLVILDVIIGNTDRNTGNILVSEGKLAAIDHGLTFPDFHGYYVYWYWSRFEQTKKPLFSSLVELLEKFPFEELSKKLSEKCFIDVRSLERMRERVVLFREGIRAGITVHEMEPLMKREYLNELYGLDSTIDAKAKEVVEGYLKNKEEEKK